MEVLRGMDVLVVSLGSTYGLRAADSELVESLRRAGASVALVCAARPRPVRTFALTDLSWALAARRAAVAGLAEYRPRAVIYSTTTASLLWPRVGAIRFDAPSAGNRPGRHGVWQRPLERRRLLRAPLLLPSSSGALAEVPGDIAARVAERVLVVPVPVEPSSSSSSSSTTTTAAAGDRDIAAITYAANPAKKGIDRVLDAWSRVRREGEELVVAGASLEELARAGIRLPADRDSTGRSVDEGIRVTGRLAPVEYRALLRRARVFVCAPRREDYGIAQLEALADGCQLVTTPAPGPYVALPLARELDPRLVGEDLAGALRAALDEPVSDYSDRAAAALSSYTRVAVDRTVREELLTRLSSAELVDTRL
jgi:glycosyltransferase involved in cell wall biosynthesis